MMYYMHWNLEDIQKLTLPQYEWIVRELKIQRKAEQRALRAKRR